MTLEADQRGESQVSEALQVCLPSLEGFMKANAT